MNRIQAIVLTGLLWSTGVVCSVNAGDDGVVDFNREVRPILAENCFYCHGQDGNKRQGELRLDQRQAALDRRAIVPADVAGSVLLQRVHSTDADLQMPPPNSGRTLTEQQKQT